MQGRRQVIEGYRLSPQQKRVWQLQQDGHAYYAQCAILIEGDLKSKTLEAALKKIMQKHEVLRTTLDWFPGLETPIQLSLENQPLPYRKVDLSNKKPEELEAAVGELFREEARPFELERGLLLRFCLCRLSTRKHFLLSSLHSLCSDSWTLRNLFKEINRFYAAELEKRELSDEPVQYLQFSEWQNELFDEGSEEPEGRSHELNRPVPEIVLQLESTLAGKRESSRHRFSPESSAATLDPRITGQVDEISKNHNSSTTGFLLACWQILLWRLSAEEEIVSDCLFDGRQFDDLHHALGLFARYVPARGILGHGLNFGEAVERATKSLQQAYASQEFFLRDVASSKSTDRANAIGFEYEEWPNPEFAGAVKFSYWKQYCCIDRFKLKLSGRRTADGLTIEIQYDPSIFSPESIELIRERYLTLIESAVERPHAQIVDLEIVGRRELERLLVEWNQTEKRLTGGRCVHEMIAEHSRERPESIAVICREERLSYGELEMRANQLANFLRSLGVGPESVVGLYLGRSVEMVIGLLGILKAGGAYLPMEAGQPAERLRVMLEDAGHRVVPGLVVLDGVAGAEHDQLDHSDRSGSATWLLQQVIAQDLADVLIVTIADRAAVEAVVARGLTAGDPFDMDVGGLADDSAGRPVRIKGTIAGVAHIAGRDWVSVAFGRGNVVVISEYLTQLMDPLDPMGPGFTIDQFKVFAIKSRVHFRRGFDDSGFAKTIVLVEPEQPFLGTVRLEALPYQNVDISTFYPYGDVSFP